MYLEVETGRQTRVSIYLKLCNEPLYMINGCSSIEQGFSCYNLYVLSFKGRNTYQLLSTNLKTIEKQNHDVDGKAKPKYVCAQILGGLKLPSLRKVFLEFSALLSHTGSQWSYESNGDRATFIATCGNIGSPMAVGDVEVEVVVVLMVGMILEVVVGLGVEPRKCTHCGCSNHSVDYC